MFEIALLLDWNIQHEPVFGYVAVFGQSSVFLEFCILLLHTVQNMFVSHASDPIAIYRRNQG